MKFGVVVFPGSNCERDCYHVASEVVGQEATYLWHKERDLKNVDAIIIPGGFSYGDYLRAGGIARLSPIMEEIRDFARRGGLVIGICNGFQVLVESGLLPGALMVNRNLKFICEDVYLRVENNDTPFTRHYEKGEVVKMPIAHKEGNYYAPPDIIRQLEDQGRVVFRYATPDGRITEDANPNGSVNNIAGIINERGNVLGMMPHPERMAEAILGGEDGKRVFTSILEVVA